MSNRELAISKVLNKLPCNPIHRIALREIFNVYEDDTMKIRTVYEMVGSKLRKDPTTVKSMLSRIISSIDSDVAMRVIGAEGKPKNKSFIKALKKKIDEEDEEAET